MNGPFRVILLDSKPQNPNHYICLAIKDAISRHRRVETVDVVTYGDAIERALAIAANLFIAFDGENLNTFIAQRLAAICGRSLLWLSEDPYELASNVSYARYFDRVFTNDRASVAKYGDKGSFLPFAADPRLHSFPVLADGDAKLRYDVLFVGSAWPNRTRILSSLLRELPDLRWKIALTTNEHLPKIALPLPPSSYNLRVSPREFARLANASRVVLDIHRDFSASAGGHSIATSPPPRLFEVGASGSAQITSATNFNIADYYEPGSQILTYETFTGLCSQITCLLADTEGRRSVATAARERTLRDHLYDNRVQTLLDAAYTIKASSDRPCVAQRLRPRLLMVTHNVVGRGGFGGVEVYVEAMVARLSLDYEVLIFSFNQNGAGNDYVVLDKDGNVLENISFNGQYQELALSTPTKERWYSEFLGRYQPDLIHYQHLLGHPISLPLISKALGIRSVLTLHDFWGLCDSFNLIDERGRYCGIDRRDASVCEPCTRLRRGIAETGYQSSRRAFFARVLSSIDVVIANANDTLDRYRQFYEAELERRACVLPVPLLHRASELSSCKNTRTLRDGAAELRVAILGNFTSAKGSNSAIAAIRLLRERPVTFVVLGRVTDDDRLILDQFENVQVIGGYDVSQLGRYIADIDITLHLSVWPETYCMALSESWAHGCIPVATRIGAPATRITDGVNGFLVAPDDPHDLVRLLSSLIDEPDKLFRIALNINACLWFSESGHVDRLQDIYESLIADSLRLPSGEQHVGTSKLSLFDCGIALSPGLRATTSASLDATSIIEKSIDSHVQAVNAPRAPSVEFVRIEKSLANVLKACVVFDNVQYLPSKLWSDDATHMFLRGWAVWGIDRITTSSPEIVLADLLYPGDVFSVEAHVENRTDVAIAEGRPAAMGSGFQQYVRINLPPGQYRLGVSDGAGHVKFSEGLTVTHSSKIVPFDQRTVQKSSSLSFVAAIDYPVSSSAPIAIVAGDLFVNGWFHTSIYDGQLFLVLESQADGERIVVEAWRYQRPDVARELSNERALWSGFRVHIARQALPTSGHYNVRPLIAANGSNYLLSTLSTLYAR